MLLQLYNKGRKATGLKRSLTMFLNITTTLQTQWTQEWRMLRMSPIVVWYTNRKLKRYTTRKVLAIEDWSELGFSRGPELPLLHVKWYKSKWDPKPIWLRGLRFNKICHVMCWWSIRWKSKWLLQTSTTRFDRRYFFYFILPMCLGWLALVLCK